MERINYTLETVPLRSFHLRVLSYTIGGSLTDGYILGMIQFALIVYTADVGLTSVWQGLITSSPLMGVFVGCLIFGRLSDKIGRQKIYTLDFIAIVILSLLQFFADSASLLFTLRLLIGICIGAEYSIGPAIVAEFVPGRIREKMLSVVCMVWTIGYVIAAYIGAWLQTTGPESWKWMLSSSAVIALIVLLIRIGMPETPRWLIMNGKIDEARKVVEDKLGSDIDLEPTIEEIQNRKSAQKGQIKDLFIGGQGKKTAFAVIAMIIVDKFPRKQFTMFFMVVALVPLLILALWSGAPAWIIVICFAVHVLGNQSFGTVTAYIYPTEVFPTEIRTTGAGFCSAVSRIFACFGTFAMPIIIEHLGISVALIGMAVILAIAVVVTKVWAPETNNVSIDEL
ncbi:MAG: MFS transporter [Firmicutes bacterium]|jgi:putative MFS transporter|nr:MFS transporter [Bacillota bacterium]